METKTRVLIADTGRDYMTQAAKVLSDKGMEVVVIDNLVNSCEKSLERVRDITGKNVEFYQDDVRDRAALDRIFEKHDISCVIHFAGLKAVGESVAKPGGAAGKA